MELSHLTVEYRGQTLDALIRPWEAVNALHRFGYGGRLLSGHAVIRGGELDGYRVRLYQMLGGDSYLCYVSRETDAERDGEANEQREE